MKNFFSSFVFVFIIVMGIVVFKYIPNTDNKTYAQPVQKNSEEISEKAKEKDSGANIKPQDIEQQKNQDALKIEKVVLTEGQKFSDILKQFGITDDKTIERILTKGRPGNQINLDEVVKKGDVIRFALSNGIITEIIIKLNDGTKYTFTGKDLTIGSKGIWKIDSTSRSPIHKVAISENLVGKRQYFYLYTGKDISKKSLDAVIATIKKRLKKGESFDLYDDFNAAKIAYINWTSQRFYTQVKDKVEFQNELKYCYNYMLEHSLVGSDNYGNVFFSNYELNDEYQDNLRNGIDKKCNPEDFVDNYDSLAGLLHFLNALNRESKRIISENEGEKCKELIRKKFRYVNALTFNDDMNIDEKENIYTISGTLNVITTSNEKVKADYSCVYNKDKKEFVDWSVDNEKFMR